MILKILTIIMFVGGLAIFLSVADVRQFAWINAAFDVPLVAGCVGVIGGLVSCSAVLHRRRMGKNDLDRINLFLK